VNVINARGFEYFTPGRVSISMKQGQAKPSKAIVSEGDIVTKGQLIGDPVEMYCVPVYASIDGVVSEVITKRISYKETAETIVINQTQKHEKKYELSMDSLSVDKGHIDFLRDIGIVGMGGKGIPTFYKYKEKKEIHTVIINGIDYEPGLTHLERLIMECPGKILFGAKELAALSKARKIVLCISEEAGEIKYILEKTIAKYQKSLGQNIEISIFTTKANPSLCEDMQLVIKVLGEPDDGAVVSNAATAVAAYDGFYDGKPLISRGITVSGCVNQPGNFWVPIGTSFKSLISHCGGLKSDQCLVLDGGVMTGISVDIEQAHVGIATIGITVIEKRNLVETPCIHCGACGEVCPVDIVPYKIEKAYLYDKNQYKGLNVQACIGCGSCSFVCPAKRRLTERILIAGKELHSRKENPQKLKKALPRGGGNYIELKDSWSETLDDLDTMTQSAPHIRRRITSSQIMYSVLMALLPTVAAVTIIYGVSASLLICVSIGACLVLEGCWQTYKREPVTIWDGSAAVTGTLLAMTLPPGTPIPLVLAGDMVAILFGKQFFGGLGQNRMNPALTGSCFIKLFAGATYLVTQNIYMKDILFISMIENVGIVLVMGFMYLALQKIVFWWPSVILVGLTMLFSNGFGGSVILGGLFLASDYASTPATYKGRLFFCLAVAGVTLLLQQLYGIDFGIYFAILIVNITCILSAYTI